MTRPSDLLLHAPLHGVDAWAAHFRSAEIPVLARTAEAIEALRQNEDEVDANLIGETVAGDPLMTLRILSHAATNRPPRMVTDTGTVTAAVVMMGIGPFFHTFGTLPTVEDRLHAWPLALVGVREVLRRSHRAAAFAFSFALHRRDPDAALIHQAALLHDFAELLLWCHAPALALELKDRDDADPSLRSMVTQQRLIEVDLHDVQRLLTRDWHLHDLLVKTADERHADHPAVRTVTAAVRLARHSAHGWTNPALTEALVEVARLLDLSRDAAQRHIHDVAG